MADNVNSEIIGGIGITLTGDYSSLQSSYAAAQVQAQQAGTAVADAFNTGVASVSDAAQVVSGSLASIEPAAAGAAGSLQQFSGAAQSAGDAAQTSEGSLASLGAQLTAIGEALAITAGLKAFAQSALDASDSITRADIALTTMTGSADKADATIKGLEDLGMQDGLSFPSLLTAAQRMTALLPPGTDVVNVIGHIADGAAAMGVSIEQAANRFDMIVNAGTLSSRALTSMGLSLDSVVTSMQHVTGASDVTTQNVTTMFKALDPGQRVQVLVDALSNLGGTAEKVAQQTFGGQWQQLANAWQEVMISVGQAILPVISDLVSFTKTDIIPFVQEMAADFSALPGPVKDAGVALAVMVGAAVPLTGILAAAAIGINGLAEATKLLGLASVETAVAQTTEAAAIGKTGTAAVAAIPEVEALAEAQQVAAVAAEESTAQYDLFVHSALSANWAAEAEQLSLFATETGAVATEAEAAAGAVGSAGLAGSFTVLAPVAALAVLSIASLKDGYEQAKATFENVSDTVKSLPSAMDAAQQANSALSTVTSTLKKDWDDLLSAFENYNTYSLAAKGINEVSNAVQLLAGNTPVATANLGLIEDALNRIQKANQQVAESNPVLAASFKAAADEEKAHASALGAVRDGISAVFVNQDKLNSTYAVAKQIFDAVNNSFQNGIPLYNGLAANAQEVAIAQQNMDAAAKAAGITIGAEAGSYQAITDAAGKLADQTKLVVSAEQQQSNEQSVANASLDLATHAYNASEIALEALTAKLHDAQSANDGSVAATQRVISAEQDVQKAYAANQKALQDLQTTQENWTTKTTADIQAAAQKQLDGLEQVAAAVGPTVSAWTGLDDEINRLAATLPNFGVVTVNLSTGPLAGLKSALAEASAKVADLSARMAEGENVGQQYQKALKAQLDAQVALDEETAVLATGLQGATDSYSLARDAVAAAQAKVDDLTIAFQSGLTTYDKVQSAQKALTAAQNALNKETSDGKTLVDALSNAYPELTANANTATNAIQQQTTSLQQDLSALQSVASAVKSVESDMQAAFGSTATSGGTVGVQPGYTLAGILTGGGDFGTRQYSYGVYADAATEAAFAKATEQGLYDQGYTPQAIAKATGDTLTNVLANLGLKPDQAGITKAMASGGSGSGTQQGGVLFGAQPPGLSAGLGLGGSGGTVSTGASGGTPLPSSGGGGTAAIDGGSYPAVTAHQATGEVWAVTTSGGGIVGGGGATTQIVQQIANTVTQTTTAAGGGPLANDTAIGGAVQALGISASSTGTAAAAMQQVATAISGLVSLIATGSIVSSGPAATVTGGSGTAYGGTPFVASTGSNAPGYNPASPITGLPTAGAGSSNTPVGNPFSGTTSAPITVTINVNGSSNPAQVAQQTATTLVAQLRAAGARF